MPRRAPEGRGVRMTGAAGRGGRRALCVPASLPETLFQRAGEVHHRPFLSGGAPRRGAPGRFQRAGPVGELYTKVTGRATLDSIRAQ